MKIKHGFQTYPCSGAGAWSRESVGCGSKEFRV